MQHSVNDLTERPALQMCKIGPFCIFIFQWNQVNFVPPCWTLQYRIDITKYMICMICIGNYFLVWPQWWDFVYLGQQGLHFSKKISKIKIFLDVHMGRHKVPKSDFQSNFSKSKIIQICVIFFSFKNISLEEGFLLLSFF